MARAGSILGNAVQRMEDPTLLTGAGQYVDDLTQPGVAHVVFARSPVAHGTITSIDVSAAEGMPGVIAVYRAEDGHDLGLAPFQGFAMMPVELNRPVFAKDTVRFVGDIVAAIVAETREQAMDAADAIVVDYDPLTAVTTAAAALAPDAPILFPEHGSNVCFATTFGDDVDALEGAETVAEVTMVSQRLAGVPMECNAILAVPGEPDGGLTCWVSHQAPHAAHEAMAPILGLEGEQLRIVCPWVGGGFGPKAAVYVEYLVAAAAAQALGRPVKWTESRSEDMVSLVHGRDFVMTAKLGLKLDGTIVGLDAKVVASGGAYPAIGAILPMLTQMMSPGVYDVPKVHFDAVTAATNTTTTGAYRGAGRPEATQLIERVMDVAADDLGIDPAELRRRNYLQPGAFPLTTITGANYDSGEYAKALDAALAAAGYDALRADQAARRERGDTVQLGIGLSSYVEVTAPIGLHVEYGAVEVHDDGSASMSVGTSVHGQGHLTAFAMLASDVLGIPMDRIRLVNSDTASVPRGSGTMGSRSLQTAGSAVHVASTEVLAKAKAIAANLLEAAADDIVVGDGQLEVSGVPSRGVSWAELAAASADAGEAARRDGGRVRCATSSTSTAATRPTRSAPTSPWSRSTSRPAPPRSCATSRSMTAGASSTRSSSPANSTAASPRERRRRCSRRSPTTTTATRSRRTSPTTPSRRLPSCPASRSATPRPTARATHSAPRESASPARSARPRPSRTR